MPTHGWVLSGSARAAACPMRTGRSVGAGWPRRGMRPASTGRYRPYGHGRSAVLPLGGAHAGMGRMTRSQHQRTNRQYSETYMPFFRAPNTAMAGTKQDRRPRPSTATTRREGTSQSCHRPDVLRTCSGRRWPSPNPAPVTPPFACWTIATANDCAADVTTRPENAHIEVVRRRYNRPACFPVLPTPSCP